MDPRTIDAAFGTGMVLAGLLLCGTAQASQLVFKASKPVTFLVDDRPASMGPNLKATSHDLEEGVHAIEVRSLFGRTLYETEVHLPADATIEAQWKGGGLAFDTDVSAPAEPAVADVPVAEPEPEPQPVPEPEPLAEPLALALPVGEPDGIAMLDPAAEVDPDAYGIPAIAEVAPGRADPVRIVIEQGDASIAIDIADGQLTLTDSEGEVQVALALGVPATPSTVRFVQFDGEGAIIVVDGEPAGAIPAGSTATSLSMRPGLREVELRSLADNRLLHLGRLDIAPAEWLEVSFDSVSPPLADREEAWTAW